MRTFVCTLVCLLLVCLVAGPANAGPFGRGTSSIDARYGSTIGAGAHWAPAYAPASRTSAEVGFGGNVALSCSGIDFQGFLGRFNPSELLTEMKDTLINGAQAAVAGYLITLAYANPTLASVLDMLDKKYTARFDAFTKACSAQESRRRGEDVGARRLAAAEDQCFAQEVQKGTAVNEAYRACAKASTFGTFDLPALKNTSDFIKRYTSINVTQQIEGLFKLLPDEDITTDGMRMRPPAVTTVQMYGNLEQRSRVAVKKILEGGDPADIQDCKEGDMSGTTSAESACLPPTAANLVASPAFLSARMLRSDAAEMYTQAMSSQIATTAMYSNILELKQQVSQMDVKSGGGAGAEEVVRRRDELLKRISSLETEVDAIKKVQEARNRAVKTQILTMQKAEEELRAQGAAASRRKSTDGLARFVRLFQ